MDIKIELESFQHLELAVVQIFFQLKVMDLKLGKKLFIQQVVIH